MIYRFAMLFALLVCCAGVFFSVLGIMTAASFLSEDDRQLRDQARVGVAFGVLFFVVSTAFLWELLS